jgi:hypothetical protein
MDKKYVVLIVAAIILAVGAVVLYENYSGVSSQATPGDGEVTRMGNPNPGTAPASPGTQGGTGSIIPVPLSVSVSAVTPSLVAVGAVVTITGRNFTTTGNAVISNGIQFAANLSSSDGATLRFTVSSAAGAYCPPTTPPRPCPMVAILITPGNTYPLTVINANGTSNAINLTIEKAGVQSLVPGSPEGMFCGGFTQNPRTCPTGFHCKLNAIADLGGICVKN